MRGLKIENIASKHLSQSISIGTLDIGRMALGCRLSKPQLNIERNQQMIRTKLGLLGLCAVVLGMMAISASSAQGATLSWLILNASKTVATELKAELSGKTDSAHLTLDAEVAGLKVALTCTAFTFKGTFLEAGGKVAEGGKMVYTGCKVYKTAPLTEEYKCTVKSSGTAAGTVETNEGKGALALVEGEVQMKIEPTTGPTGNFATLRFEGAECPLPELNQFHGTIYLKDCQGALTKHALEHLVEASASTLLYIGGHSTKQLEVTKMLGSFWLRLVGAHAGLDWAALDTP